MDPFSKKPNGQNFGPRYDNNDIVRNRTDSAYSFGKDPDTSPKDEAKTNTREKDEFDYSHDKEVDGDKGQYKTGRKENPLDKNIWIKDTNKEHYLNNHRNERRDQTLSSSVGTTHSYVDIDDIPAKPGRAKPRKKSNRCRIIQIAVVVIVLGILGMVTVFIVRNFTSKDKSCGNPPSIGNGHVNKTEGTGKRNAFVFCMSGYGTGINQTITCDDNGDWDPIEPCQLTGCGHYPNIENGLVTGTEQTFNSTAKLSCDNGFLANNTVSFKCLSNGSWVSDTEPKCTPHPCGLYTLPEHVIVKEDLSAMNMSVILQCNEGFDFKEKSDMHILCDNNTWSGSPECEIPGLLKMLTTNSPVQVGGSLVVSCSLTASTSWQTVALSRSDLPNDTVPEYLYSVTNDHKNGTTEKRHSAKLFNKEVSTSEDGVLIVLTFTDAHCTDTGRYTCSVIVGDILSPIESKTTEKEIKVIDIGSKVTEIVAKTSHVQGDVVDVLCKGILGKDEFENKLGEIHVRIYWDENTSKDMNSTIESTKDVGCQVEDTVKSTFVITNDMDGAELQCILRDNDESRDKKSILLNVTTTKIDITTSSSRVNIGQSLNIATQLSHIRGWTTIELRKNCSGTELAIFSLQANETVSNLTTENHITLIESEIDNTTATLEYHFTSVRCSDACWKGGELEYLSAVKIGDSWIKDYETIEFQKEPSEPVLSLAQDKFYRGQVAILICTGNIGIPGHSMDITENGTLLPTPPSITMVNVMNETCENVQTITFEFNVREELDGQVYQCEINLDNGTKLVSNEEIINVTNPILYFTEDSKTGIAGSTKTIQCILTDVANVTHVVVSRHQTAEEQLCEVSVTGDGSCDSSEFSIDGSMSANMTEFTTILSILDVSCKHEGYYSCKAMGVNTIKTSMDFQVIVPATVPELRFPRTIVEDQKLEWEDRFNCTANLGYPVTNRQLKIQIKRQGSISYVDYETKVAENGICSENTSIDLRQHVFKADTNGSLIRCVVVDEHDTVITTSMEKTLRLLKNICLNEATGDFDPHPYDCSRYVRCVSGRLYDIQCASGACALGDTMPICSGSNCAKCYT